MAPNSCDSTETPRGRLYVMIMSEPRRTWKLIHFLLYVLITISSMAAMVPAYKVREKFANMCPLYTDPIVSESSVVERVLLRIENPSSNHNHGEPVFKFEDDTKWSEESMCNFGQFMPAASFMFAIIWAWFFCICSSQDDNNIWSAGITKPWRLVPPATFFTILMTIVILVAAVVMTQGMQHFCNRLEKSPVEGCWNAEQVTWIQFPNLPGFYGQHLRAVAAIWVCTSAWCIATIVLLIRCCCTNVDFANTHGTPMEQLRRRSSYEHLKQEEQT